MKLHAAVAEALAANGVDTAFGLVGDANLFVVEALVREHGLRYVAAAHEGGATSMADGYARVTGKLGVATVTHGPGLTNTITALTEAARNGTPLLLLCGSTPAADRENLQWIDQAALVAPTGAAYERVAGVATVYRDVAIAVRRAFVERRPVVLDVPVELQFLDVEDGAEPVVLDRHVGQVVAPDPAALDVAVGMLMTARRTIVLAGRGATSGPARDALLRLAERIGAPVATTLLAKDLFHGVQRNIGVFGTLADDLGVEVINEADCVIAFGAGLNWLTTSMGMLLRGKRVIHCDIEPGHIGRFCPVDAGIVGEAAEVADTIVRWLDEAEVTPPTEIWSARIQEKVLANRTGTSRQAGDTPLDIRAVVAALQDLLPRDRALVLDVGRFMVPPIRQMHVPEPRDFVFAARFAAIGLGLPMAVGAAVGRERGRGPVVALVGDGGFMVGGLTEFNTAVRHGTDLVVVVFNDGGYGAEYTLLRNRNVAVDMSLVPWPDFAPVAEALGGHGLTVRSMDDLPAVADAIANRNRPLLIDVKLDPAAVPDVAH